MLSGTSTPGELQVFKWLRDRPPALAATTSRGDDGTVQVDGYATTCFKSAGTFADIWSCEDAPPFTWPSDMGDADWLPDPDALRSHSITFSQGTSYGSDNVHPRHIALLSDHILWDIILICTQLFRLGVAPAALSFVLIRLIPKSLGGVRPISALHWDHARLSSRPSSLYR